MPEAGPLPSEEQPSSMFRKIDKWLEKAHGIPLVLIMTASTYAISGLLGFMFIVMEGVLNLTVKSVVTPVDKNISYVIFGASVVPIIETAVFQHGAIRYLRTVPAFKTRDAAVIGMSAAAFGLVHLPRLPNIVHAFLLGLVLSYSYVLRERDPASAFWTVTAIHALRNLISGVLGILWG